MNNNARGAHLVGAEQVRRVTIHLFVDQLLPADEVDEIVDRYVDELAKTAGELTWEVCDWTVEEVSE